MRVGLVIRSIGIFVTARNRTAIGSVGNCDPSQYRLMVACVVPTRRARSDCDDPADAIHAVRSVPNVSRVPMREALYARA